jgi:hypothetical protein
MIARHRQCLAAAIILQLLLAGPAWAGGKRARAVPVKIAELDLREGDILLQHFASKLGSVIADVSNSQYSHCGMVVYEHGKPHVIEAIGPVRIVPVEDWLKQGHLNRFTQLRPRSLSPAQISKVRGEAEKMLGQPYDIQYEWDDHKIYCSELIYKAFDRALGIEIGRKEKLGDLNWKSHPLFIAYLAGGKLPLKRVMVTPESLVHCKQLKLITSTFPPHKDEPMHDHKVLAGKWRGEYTIRGQATGLAVLQFDSQGRLITGKIETQPSRSISIETFQVPPFRNQREFAAQLSDARGIATAAKLKIRDDGDRIIGTWKDDLGNVGLLSFERLPPQ